MNCRRILIWSLKKKKKERALKIFSATCYYSSFFFLTSSNVLRDQENFTVRNQNNGTEIGSGTVWCGKLSRFFRPFVSVPKPNERKRKERVEKGNWVRGCHTSGQGAETFCAEISGDAITSRFVRSTGALRRFGPEGPMDRGTFHGTIAYLYSYLSS